MSLLALADPLKDCVCSWRVAILRDQQRDENIAAKSRVKDREGGEEKVLAADMSGGVVSTGGAVVRMRWLKEAMKRVIPQVCLTPKGKIEWRNLRTTFTLHSKTAVTGRFKTCWMLAISTSITTRA